jgi:hypothetical protein
MHFLSTAVLTTAWRMNEKNIVRNQEKYPKRKKESIQKYLFLRNGKEHEELQPQVTLTLPVSRGLENVTPLYPNDIDPLVSSYMMYTSGSTS